MEQNKAILQYLKKYTLAALATVGSDGKPEVAIVGFAEDENLEIVFGCSEHSRKYQNLKTNLHVAFAIGGTDGATIQYEGMARELSGEEEQQAKEMHVRKIPSAAKYASSPDNRYFKVTPSWIRYVDMASESKSFEFKV